MISDAQFHEILDQILSSYGFDFKAYTHSSLKRRMERLMQLDKIAGFTEFIYKINNQPEYADRLINELSVNFTEMFRDPDFYFYLRRDVLPVLSTNPRIRIWHAGCSTGEEVFSMAILLKELNLYHKSLLYATDISTKALSNLKIRKVPLNQMKLFTENYHDSGGTEDFSKYYSAKYNSAIFNEELMENVIFSNHNLVSDASFNEFDLIICRNVIIYFNKNLQERVFKLFDESLSKLGFLALGSRENLRFSSINNKYAVQDNQKIWRKMSL